jgi:hypothetical protein
MNNALQIGKKAFTWSVVVLTILWSMGIAALVPLAAQAQTSCPSLSAGDLFKVPGNSAVYLLNSGMQRLYFPHSNIYHTWFTDFSGVVEIPTTCVDAYPSPLIPPFGINVRPGSRMVKVTISPSVYVVEPANKISKITSEQIARDLYGSAWATQVIDINDAFWPNYVNRGPDLTESIPHNGMLLKTAASSDVWYVKEGLKYRVDGSVRATAEVRLVTQAVADRVGTGIGSVTAASIYDNPSQGSGSSSTLPPSAGAVSVALAADTPNGTYAVDGAARVPFTKLVFTAGASAVTITSFKVIRGGSPAVNSDFATINVLDPEGNLLNDAGKTLNSDSIVTFTEDITIAANSSKTYTLVGDMAANVGQGNQPRLGLYSVETTAGVNASLPLYGNPVETNTNVALGTVTLAEGTSVGTVTKQVGTNNVLLASLKITVATEDFQVERIVLQNAGTTADADVQNLKLKYNNEVVANGTMASKYLTFNLSACTSQCKILKGNDKTFDVYGDIIGGSARTMNLDVQRAVHVLAKDLKNGYYVTPTNNASAMTNTVTISQGKLNVTKTNDVPTGNVPENASNVALASFNFKVTGEPIDVRTLVFRVSTTGTVVPTGFDSVTVYNAAGVALTGGVDATGGTAGLPGYATTTDSFTLPVGDNLLTVKAKIDATPANNDIVVVSIDMSNSSNFEAKGVNSGDTITLGTYATPNAFVTGNTMTINTAALRVTQLPTPVTTTYAAGTNDVIVAEVLLDAGGSSEDLKITQFITKDYADSGAKTIDIQNIRLYVDKDGDSDNGSGTQVALSEVQNGSDSDANDDETFTFNLSGDDQFTVKAGKKVKVSIKANITGGASTGNHIFRTNAANDVTAVGVSTNSTVSEVVDTGPQGAAVTVGAAGGTVQVSIDSSNPDAKQIAAGTQGVTLATFNFFATTTETIEIDTLTLTQRVTATNSSSFQNYDLLYLVDEAGATVGSVVPTSTGPFIDLNSGAFIVNRNDTDGAKLHLKANVSAMGSSNEAFGGHSLGFNIAAGAHVLAPAARRVRHVAQRQALDGDRLIAVQ